MSQYTPTTREVRKAYAQLMHVLALAPLYILDEVLGGLE